MPLLSEKYPYDEAEDRWNALADIIAQEIDFYNDDVAMEAIAIEDVCRAGEIIRKTIEMINTETPVLMAHRMGELRALMIKLGAMPEPD